MLGVFDALVARGQRYPLGDLLDAHAGHLNLHTLGDRGSMPPEPRCRSAPAVRPRRPSRPATFGAARCTVCTTPPSSIRTVLALTTGSAIPASGTLLPRDAAARRLVGHLQLREGLVHGRRGGPHLLAVVAVQRQFQRPAAAQDDGVGLVHGLVGREGRDRRDRRPRIRSPGRTPALGGLIDVVQEGLDARRRRDLILPTRPLRGRQRAGQAGVDHRVDRRQRPQMTDKAPAGGILDGCPGGLEQFRSTTAAMCRQCTWPPRAASRLCWPRALGRRPPWSGGIDPEHAGPRRASRSPGGYR